MMITYSKWISNNTNSPLWQFLNSGNSGSDNFSFIGGGYFNSSQGHNSVVTGGRYNRIDVALGYLSVDNFIGGGMYNTINGATAGGYYSNYGVIGGGSGNVIGNNTVNAACYSTIAGGLYNNIQSSCSSIVGSHNYIGPAFPNAHIVGSGISTVPGLVGNPNSLHTNCLWMGNVYRSVGIPPPFATIGTVWVDTTGGANILKIV